jgi:hypothetical protein
MDGRRINTKEQSCIADCIKRYWGDTDRQDDVENRNRDYEQCLTDCQICG